MGGKCPFSHIWPTARHWSGADGVLVCQDAVKLLHNRVERSSTLAHKLLSEHLQTFLQQPRVLQLLLSSLPAAASRQRLLFCSLCQLLKPGEAASMPSSTTYCICENALLRVPISCSC